MLGLLIGLGLRWQAPALRLPALLTEGGDRLLAESGTPLSMEG